MGAMVPPSRKSCYNFRVTEINRVVDGDTIDVTIDLGFDLYKKERVRVAGVDTPEKRTRDLEEKALGLDATNWMKKNLEETIDGDEELTIRTELVGGMGKYGRLLGWLYVGDDTTSLNEQMIEEGYAWAYDGGTKQKNFEELREIRRSKGLITLLDGNRYCKWCYLSPSLVLLGIFKMGMGNSMDGLKVLLIHSRTIW